MKNTFPAVAMLLLVGCGAPPSWAGRFHVRAEPDTATMQCGACGTTDAPIFEFDVELEQAKDGTVSVVNFSHFASSVISLEAISVDEALVLTTLISNQQVPFVVLATPPQQQQACFFDSSITFLLQRAGSELRGSALSIATLYGENCACMPDARCEASYGVSGYAQ